MDTQRIIALIVFSFSALLLWEAWQKHNKPVVFPAATTATQSVTTVNGGLKSAAAMPGEANAVPSATASQTLADASAATKPADDVPARSVPRVTAQTDTLDVEFDAIGGDIRQAVLRNHVSTVDTTKPFTLMQEKVGHYFVAQSGLLGEGLPNHTSNWSLVALGSGAAHRFEMGNSDKLEVVFANTQAPGVTVNKTFTFKRGSYVVDVRYDIKNETPLAIAPKAYFQFLRDANPPEGESTGSNPFTGVATFTGPAVYTDAKKFQKLNISDIEKNKADHVKESSDGWIAMVQHYFVSAWLPQGTIGREFFTKRVTDKLFSAGVIVPVGTIAPSAAGTLSMPLYVGPQEQDNLNKLAPGLGLVVDYGWLTVLAYPMFVVLSFINQVMGNWGWTIILFTVLLKLAFFPLNQKSGKSMAHMKTLMPKMEALKARYGDDKLKLNQATTRRTDAQPAAVEVD